MSRPRHYIRLGSNLGEYAAKVDPTVTDWMSAVFNDITENGNKLMYLPLDKNALGSRIALYGDKYYCEGGFDNNRADSLFIFKVERAGTKWTQPKVAPRAYDASLELIEGRAYYTSLDPINDLMSPDAEDGSSDIRTKLTNIVIFQGFPSEQLLQILHQVPPNIRRQWRPTNIAVDLRSPEEFITSLRVPWVRYELHKHARLSVRQDSLIKLLVKPTEMGKKERIALLSVFDFSMLNSFARENSGNPNAVYNLLDDLSAFSLPVSMHARLWTSMLTGLEKNALLRELYEASDRLSQIYEQPDGAQVWEKQVLSAIAAAAEKGKDQSLAELVEDCQEQSRPLEFLARWTQRLEFQEERESKATIPELSIGKVVAPHEEVAPLDPGASAPVTSTTDSLAAPISPIEPIGRAHV